MTLPPTDPSPPAPVHDPDWRMAQHWPELTVAVTEQAVETVERLLRGLEVLVQRGRLNSQECQVLSGPAQRLRQCAVHAQQIVRLQSGQVRQTHEKIDLADLLEMVLQEQRDELAMTGITVRRKLQAAPVLIDPALGYALARAMLAWAVPLGHSIDLRLDIQGEPGRAQVHLHVPTAHTTHAGAVWQDGLHWLLLRQIAATDAGIELQRELRPDGVWLQAEFKRTLLPGDAPA